MYEKEWFTTVIYGRAIFATPEQAEQILTPILRHQSFCPNRFGWHEPVRNPFSVDEMEGAITALNNETRNRLYPNDTNGTVLLNRTGKPRCHYTVHWSRSKSAPFGVSSYSVEEKYVQAPSNLKDWLDFIFSIIPIHDAWFAYFTSSKEDDWKNHLSWIVPPNAPSPWTPGTTAEGFFGTRLHENIPGVYWGNYFGPFYVQWFGEKNFLSLPCVEISELPTGGIFFTTATTPWEWDKLEYVQIQRQVMEHLGTDAFFDVKDLRSRMKQNLGKGRVYEPSQLLQEHQTPDFPFGDHDGEMLGLHNNQRVDIIDKQQKLGFTLVDEEKGHILIFENDQGYRTEIDLDRKSLSYWPKGKSSKN